MRSAFAELRSNDSVLRIAVVVAIVVSGVDVLEAATYLATQWIDLFGDFPLGWRFYIEPLLRSLIVFTVVIVASAFVLRLIHRRQEVLSAPEEP